MPLSLTSIQTRRGFRPAEMANLTAVGGIFDGVGRPHVHHDLEDPVTVAHNIGDVR